MTIAESLATPSLADPAQVLRDMQPWLSRDEHRSPEEGICLLELVSILSGQPFTAYPDGVSATLGHFGRTLSDGLDDEIRQRLIPLAALLVHSERTDLNETARENLAAAQFAIDHTVTFALDTPGPVQIGVEASCSTRAQASLLPSRRSASTVQELEMAPA